MSNSTERSGEAVQRPVPTPSVNEREALQKLLDAAQRALPYLPGDVNNTDEPVHQLALAIMLAQRVVRGL